MLALLHSCSVHYIIKWFGSSIAQPTITRFPLQFKFYMLLYYSRDLDKTTITVTAKKQPTVFKCMLTSSLRDKSIRTNQLEQINKNKSILMNRIMMYTEVSRNTYRSSKL